MSVITEGSAKKHSIYGKLTFFGAADFVLIAGSRTNGIRLSLTNQGYGISASLNIGLVICQKKPFGRAHGKPKNQKPQKLE
jgi:hypothetical protein